MKQTTGGRVAFYRKMKGMTQGELAEKLGVSAQAVSKWENDAAYPETEKLIRLSKLLGCSLDYLLLGTPPEPEERKEPERGHLDLRDFYMERVSEKKIGNLPLWHINIGYGRTAKGVFALGLTAKGVVAVGLASVGLVSVGVAGVGVLAIGAFAAGLMALGAVAAGLLAAGAVAVGCFAQGALAVGQFAVGAAAMGNYAALGDAARGAVAIGKSEAAGELFRSTAKLTPADIEKIRGLLDETVPWYLGVFKKLFLLFVK